MPRTEAQKRAQQKYLKKWRENNREKYNEMQKRYTNKYNAEHREERRIYASNRYYKITPAPNMSLEEWLEQFDGEVLTDDEQEGEESGNV